MARIRAPLGLTVYPAGWGGSYDPSLDPLVPFQAPPLTYDRITGLPTTASEIQQILREDYPADWTGGIGHLGQSDPSIYDSSTTSTAIYAPIDTSGYTTLLNNATPTGTLTTSDLSDLGLQTYSSLDPSLVSTLNNLPTTSPVPVSMLPSTSQLATIAAQGTGTGLSAAQIANIFNSAASAGINVFKATSSPYAIPGTSLVYNPATGQLASSTGLTAAGLATVQAAGITASSLTSMMPIILIAGGLMLLFMVMGNKH
jgi:hypothetical protein